MIPAGFACLVFSVRVGRAGKFKVYLIGTESRAPSGTASPFVTSGHGDGSSADQYKPHQQRIVEGSMRSGRAPQATSWCGDRSKLPLSIKAS
jgi:hypothetical protein